MLSELEDLAVQSQTLLHLSHIQVLNAWWESRAPSLPKIIQFRALLSCSLPL